MQVSRGKHRLLSAHDRQIYVARPYDGYRTSSCVADSSRLCPASNLPALHPFGYGAYLYVNPRFCFQLPSGVHRCNHPCLRLPFASVRLGLDFARYLCHSIGQHHLAAGPCPAHNLCMNPDWNFAGLNSSRLYKSLCRERKMPYAPFHKWYPKIAKQETRCVTILPGSPWNLPPAHYSLLEMYCDEPGCDCRRVFLAVLSSLTKQIEGAEDRSCRASIRGQTEAALRTVSETC